MKNMVTMSLSVQALRGDVMKKEVFMNQEKISDLDISRYDDPKALLRFAVQVSGRTLKAIADDIGMNEKQFIRALSHNPNDNRHFPFENITTFLDAIDNDIPLRWLALKRGFGLVRLKSSVEIENERLKRELEEKAREMDVIKAFLKEVKL